jgi:hypothetical protein
MDIESEPTLISPCHAYSFEDEDEDDEPPTMRIQKSAPPPEEIPISDGDILDDEEPVTLRY